MKKLRRVFVILLMLTTLLALLQSSYVSAAYDMMSTINSQAGLSGDTSVTGSVTSIAGAVITIARVICAAVAITMLAILGMKYMMSAPEDRASIKKHAVVYVVGAIVMFACTGILSILQQFATNITPS